MEVCFPNLLSSQKFSFQLQQLWSKRGPSKFESLSVNMSLYFPFYYYFEIFSLQPRTEVLLKTLVSEEVNSACKLRRVWQKDPKCKFPFILYYSTSQLFALPTNVHKTVLAGTFADLLEAYKKWLPESAHNKAVALWPPL